MPSFSSTTDQGGPTSVTAVHPDIIQTHILTRLDGPTLASASCTSFHLRSLSNEENLWKHLCNSTWPSTTNILLRQVISSFPSGHRSFFSDSFPTFHHHHRHLHHPSSELISAVDIHHVNRLIFSRVTGTTAKWFQSSNLWIDLLDRDEKVSTPLKFQADQENLLRMRECMKLSWIFIDPIKKRAMNLSSSGPVSVKRHWLTGDIHLKYAIVMEASDCYGWELVRCRIVMICGGKEGGDLHVREVNMRMEDINGKILSGKKSLGILMNVMDGDRRRRDREEERKRNEEYRAMKRERRQRRERRQTRLDMVYTVTTSNMLCLAMGFTFLLLVNLILSR